MRGSILASYIDRDYRIKKAFEQKNRQKCKEKKCVECKYQKICKDKEESVIF